MDPIHDSTAASSSSSIFSWRASQSSESLAGEDSAIYCRKQKELDGLIQRTKILLSQFKVANVSDWVIQFPRKGILPSDGGISASLSLDVMSPKLQVFGLPVENKPSGTLCELPSTQILMDSVDEKGMKFLMDRKFEDIYQHLEKLSARVRDTSSKILVTGDLNAGKSTFINALLGGDEVLPTDQQPCTSAFCEVVAMTSLRGQEASFVDPALPVHAIRVLERYDISQPGTYTPLTIAEMQEAVADEASPYKCYKVYRQGLEKGRASTLLLNNEVVDISLIDSPGLNHDSFHTMSLFAKQDDIDVIVFLINAANHLTLSASEFLQTASKEKDYMFVIVNRFDDIRNKDKCRQLIMKQISQVLPKTYEESGDLVHFISAREHIRHLQDPRAIASPLFEVDPSSSYQKRQFPSSFARLEAALRSFVLDKRAKSKLRPARTYLLNLLRDLQTLSVFNNSLVSEQLRRVQLSMDTVAPLYEKLFHRKDLFVEDLDRAVDELTAAVQSRCERILQSFLEEDLEAHVSFIEWRGVWRLWSYLDTLADTLDRLAEAKVAEAARASNDIQLRALHQLQGIAAQHIPELFAVDPNTGSGSTKMQGDGASVLEIDAPSLEETLMPRPALAKLDMLDFRSELKDLGAWLGLAGLSSLSLLALTRQFSFVFSWSGRFLFSRQAIAATSLLVVGGIGYALLTDAKRILDAKACAKLKQRMVHSSWALQQARLLGQFSRRALKKPAWDMTKEYHQKLSLQENIKSDLEAKKQRLMYIFNFFEHSQRSILALSADITSLEL